MRGVRGANRQLSGRASANAATARAVRAVHILAPDDRPPARRRGARSRCEHANAACSALRTWHMKLGVERRVSCERVCDAATPRTSGGAGNRPPPKKKIWLTR